MSQLLLLHVGGAFFIVRKPSEILCKQVYQVTKNSADYRKTLR